MCALAGSGYDGAFLNWMTPEAAEAARGHVHAGAVEAGRKPPPVLGYVRTAVGPDAEERLKKDEAFYRDLHDGYRNHFKRLGAEPGTVGVASESPYVAQAELAKYEALDVVVVRGLASATAGGMTELAGAVAPGGSEARVT
jgi:alkanesulfonate monooxygenase SsuD/methylene tetrahydromethanopterin reductase-like flavin-dependent oxidoreductase (luciferase family)